jgi:GDP-6-deoxy-D-talose 4-dehydrogenase
MKTLLLTGADGFTGRYINVKAQEMGFKVHALQANLIDKDSLFNEVLKVSAQYVIHLAGISAVTHANLEEFYKVNLFGTLNLLDAQKEVKTEKIILASSANIYGNVSGDSIGEEQLPKPLNHYAMSKFAMELMAQNYLNQLPISITRPFNYTGVGHDLRFVIPKLVGHFQRKEPFIELGNLDVYREYNDVRMVSDMYIKLLQTGTTGQTYNLCTGKSYSLGYVIECLEKLTNHQIEVRVNPQFVRANEVKVLSGAPFKIKSAIGSYQEFDLEETLSWMLENQML